MWPQVKHALLHEHGRDRTAPLVEARFDNKPLGGTLGRSLQLQHFGLQKHVFKEFVDALAGLGGNRAERHVAAVLFGDDARVDEFLLDAIGIGFGLVDLVDRDDKRNARRTSVRDGFLRLGHDAVVGRHHENDDVGRLGTAGGMAVKAS